MAVNRVILVGNVGNDPDVKNLDSGTKLCRISLATSESYKDNGQNKEHTEWHKVVLWKNLAGVAEKYVKKGDMLYIDGKIKTRSFKDKNGNQRYITEIHGNNMTMLGGQKNTSNDQVNKDEFLDNSSDDKTTRNPPF
jgi:single-strand DNA-binding protein